MAYHIRKKANDELGMNKGRQDHIKETWWNIEVQAAIKEKNMLHKWKNDRSIDTFYQYKKAKKYSILTVWDSKNVFDDIYMRLGTKEGEKDVNIK